VSPHAERIGPERHRSAASLPFVCAWCDRVRTTSGCWESVDEEVQPLEATHGICPDCLAAETRAAGLPA